MPVATLSTMTGDTQRRLAAIVLADVVGYSRLMGADDTGTLEAMRAHREELWDPTIERFGGRLVNRAGDSALIEFSSAVAAMECSVAIQSAMAERNADVPDGTGIQLRMGVTVGEVVVDGDEIYGDGVNIAARLQTLAPPGGIALSGTAQENIDNRLDLDLIDAGEHEVKNINRPIRVWYWSLEDWNDTVEPVAGQSEDGASPSGPNKPSIAVLPFSNMSGDPDQEYFSDGISEDLITNLARFPWMFVVARNSTFVYKNQSVDIRQAAQELGVRYVLEGSVRKSGERVRITSQMIDGNTGNHIWADRFDRKLSDIFDLQDEISTTIAASLQPVLYAAEGERAALKNPQNMDAWDLFLRARKIAYVGTREANEEAVALARKALSLDENSAGALKVLASCLYHQVVSRWSSTPGRAFSEALEAAERAVEIERNDAEAHEILGLIYLGYRRHDEALRETETAVDLNQCYARGYVSLGTCHTYSGNADKAFPLFQKAMEISPRDLDLTYWRCTRSLSRLLTGDYLGAVEDAKYSATRKDYWAPSRWYWAASAALAGLDNEADDARSEVLRLNPDFSISMLRKAHPFRRNQDFSVLAEGLRKAGLPE